MWTSSFWICVYAVRASERMYEWTNANERTKWNQPTKNFGITFELRKLLHEFKCLTDWVYGAEQSIRASQTVATKTDQTILSQIYSDASDVVALAVAIAVAVYDLWFLLRLSKAK